MKVETPIRRQYLEIKKNHRNALLLFRLGDFYEAFDDDARILSKELDIVLTSKPMGKDLRIPLAGVPFHSLERHLATLISKGYRVAICEQLTDTPIKNEDGKRLIKRDVVRIITPGTVIEPSLLENKKNNYIAAFFSDGKKAGISYADISTGEFLATEIENAKALAELQRISPSEILLAQTENEPANQETLGFTTFLPRKVFEFANSQKILFKHFSTKTLEPFGLEKKPLAVSAAAAIIKYLQETQFNTLEQLSRLTSYNPKEFMMLDSQTFKSLEVFESLSGGLSLLAVLDETKTPMGGRLLRNWLKQPLLNVAEIFSRQEHLTFFVENQKAREVLQSILENIHDIERLISRTQAGLISSMELISLGKSLELIPEVKRILQSDSLRFRDLLEALPLCEEVAGLIKKAINEDLPTRFDEKSGMIRHGFSPELDKLRQTLKDGRTFLADLESRERSRSGIRNLKVAFNKVFGYFIEVSKANLHLVPEDFVRKQTLVNAERFITLELKEYESLVLNSQERLSELESSIFRQICFDISKKRQHIFSAGKVLSYLDAIISLAEAAAKYNFSRPLVNEGKKLLIKEGRHPVVERMRSGFVANDTFLGGEKTPRIALLTGPNASGKSTYLRQIAIIVLMAQIGSFVPAKEAEIGLIDRIFTRIGLYDRIGLGDSTFMTEMIETAEILHHATPKSLILLDELGRGTSTFDGLAVARSVIEFIHNHPKIASKTLFATHYHELAELEEVLPLLRNFHVEIVEEGEDLVFKYKVSKGVSLKSYGIYAAKIAGLPKPVIRRATELLRFYEKAETSEKTLSPNLIKAELIKALEELDLDTLSPVESLMKLYEIKKISQA